MRNLIISIIQYKSKSIHTSLGEIVQAKGNYDTCPIGWVRNVILKNLVAQQNAGNYYILKMSSCANPPWRFSKVGMYDFHCFDLKF